ncbi:hypothetical protein LSUCC0246_09860 [Rhodobacterales bacterium LSUCC0246]|nr:hypothetical protein [Rhodobacterales bacterium LSUCC0374]
MKQRAINLALASAALLLSAGQLKAQDVAPEIEALVGELATEGYSEFTLEDTIFTPPTLLAEGDGVLLELKLDPETLEAFMS